MKTSSHTIGAVYAMATTLETRRTAARPPSPRTRQRRPRPLEPEPQPGNASRIQSTRSAASTIATPRHLRTRPARSATAVAVHPDVHDRVPVRAVPDHASVELALRPRAVEYVPTPRPLQCSSAQFDPSCRSKIHPNPVSEAQRSRQKYVIALFSQHQRTCSL